MKTLIILVLLIHDATAVLHSLQYFYTASTGIADFPEFVTVGVVDNQPISYYDSVTKREIPKQYWMERAEGPEYWEEQTKISITAEQNFRVSIHNVRMRLNQTEGVHVVQRMYGCKWDNESGEAYGFNQYGYDGEDFIILDIKTLKWIAPKVQAVLTKMKWDHHTYFYESDKEYFTHKCVEWLKTYLNHGKNSLLRTVRPSVSLLQKSPSSPVSCHATGFYPDRATMFWRKDGQKLHEDVDHGEILPNHDGTFQMRVDLKLSSVKPEDWRRYDCVFLLSGVKEDVTTKLDKAVLRRNEEKLSDMFVPIIAAVVVGLVLVVIVVVIGAVMYKKKKKDKKTPLDDSPQKESVTDDSYGSKGKADREESLIRAN